MKDERFSRVIIESPFSGDVARNNKYLQRIIRDCIARGESPYASHQMLTDALNDSDPHERATGMRAGRDWYEAASRCVVYTDYGTSGGMEIGIAHARDIGLEVEFRTIGENPPEPEIAAPPRGRRGAHARKGETKQRAIELRKKNLTHAQIAAVLGCTTSNVWHHLNNDAVEAEADQDEESTAIAAAV